MRRFIFLMIFGSSSVLAHPNYTAYSGAPGSRGACASSCHGRGTGTIVVSGIPGKYVPLKTYKITVSHDGGLAIANFNASARLATSTTVAGSFSAGAGTMVYTETRYESGVSGSAKDFDEATFSWKAPASGSGIVTFYISGLQGTSAGPNSKLTVRALEDVNSSVEAVNDVPQEYALLQNYPNPFNPSTTIEYRLPAVSHVSLKVYDLLGREVVTLVEGEGVAGKNSVLFTAGNLPSGVYFYRLQAGSFVETKKLVFVR
jgi:hypothetical protein